MSFRAFNWMIQRVTGAALVILLVMHFWVEHFEAGPVRHGQMTFAVIQQRLANPWMQAVDLAFLVIALYHGLNGLRNIVLDFSVVTPRIARVVTVIIVLGGIFWAYWGFTAFVGNPAITQGLMVAR